MGSDPGVERKPISAPPSFPILPLSFIESSLQSWERYELVGFVGEGGMGRVYKALDPALNRAVALKFLRREDPELQRRLIREAQAQAKIHHPHVCEIYEVAEFQNHVYKTTDLDRLDGPRSSRIDAQPAPRARLGQ